MVGCPIKKGTIVTHKVNCSVRAPIKANIDMEFYITDERKRGQYRSTFNLDIGYV